MSDHVHATLTVSFIFLLLLTTSVAPPPSRRNGTRSGIACEGSTLSIRCPSGNIEIKKANWGRLKREICSYDRNTEHWSTDCFSARGLGVVSNMCDGKPRCWVPANNRMFHDPCSDTPKYLEVHWNCVKVPSRDGVSSSDLTNLHTSPRGTRTHISPQMRNPFLFRYPSPIRQIFKHIPTFFHTATTTSAIIRTFSLATLNYSETLETQEVKGDNSADLIAKSQMFTPISVTPVTFTSPESPSEHPAEPWVRVHFPFYTSLAGYNAHVTTKSYATRPSTTPEPTTTPSPTTTTTQSTTTPSTSTSTTTTPTPSTTAPTTTTTSTTKPTTTTESKVKPPSELRPGCDPMTRRSIYWPKTEAGAVSTQPCPNNMEETATRVCGRNGIWHEKADLSRCVSPRTMALKQKIHDENVEKIAPELAEITDEKELYGGDVVELTSMMSEIVDQVEVEIVDLTPQQKKKTTQKVSENVVKAGSNLLAQDNKPLWEDLPQSDQNEAATRLVNAVEKSGFKLADTIEGPLMAPIVSIEVNIIMEVNVISTTGRVEGITFPNQQTFGYNGNNAKSNWRSKSDCIHLPGNAIRSMGMDDGLAKLVFATYSNLQELLSPQRDQPKYETIEEETNVIDVIELGPGDEDMLDSQTTKPPKKKNEQFVNSNIISASINNRTEKIIPLPEPITYTLEHKSDNIYNPTCSFWEYSERTMTGEWSSFGCKLIDTNLTHTVCQCEHLTNFAVLMDVVGVDMSTEHIQALTYITFIGCIISIVCLFIAWLTFQFCKNLQCDRNTIHKNLVFCLFVAEIVFLLGIAQHEKVVLCSVIAAVLHYLFLAAFAWMCLEGVQLYMMLIEVFEAERSRVKYYYVAAYGIPALIVGISAAVNYKGYGTDKYCWLSTENGFIWAFVGPAMAVISVNIVMLSIAIYVMCRHAAIASSLKMKEKSRLENIKKEKGNLTECPKAEMEQTEPSAWSTHISWVKGASVLVVLLGLTWTFGVLFLSDATMVFAYIFTILNSLQGLFIFVFHCAMNEKVQKEYKRCVRHMSWLPACIRVKYGGAKPYTSTSPHSTSSGSNYFQRLLSGRRRKRSSTTTLQRSSTPSTKWNYQHVHAQYSAGPDEPAPPPPMHTLSNCSTTEDQDGYLEPVNLRIHDSIYAEPDECLGDLSMIDGSIVDSNCVSDYIRDGGMATVPPIDVDKYKIKPPPRKPKGLHQLSVEDPHISESEYSDGELFSMTGGKQVENVYESCPPLKKPPISELEKNLKNNLFYDDDSLKKKNRCSTSSGNSSCSDDSLRKDSPSLNDLNKGDSGSSRNSIYLSTPNIKFKNGTGCQDYSDNIRNSTLQRSLPNLADTPPEQVAIEKLKKAVSSKEDGLINLSHGKKIERNISQETKEALAGRPYRLTSSDC